MIVSLYAGLLAAVFGVLSLNVILRRYKIYSALGDDGDFEIKRRIRAHANFAEYTPLFLILMGFAEHDGFNPTYVHVLCAMFLLGRISHALSICKLEKYENGKILAYPIWRAVGMFCTFTPIIITSLFLIWQGL